MAATISAKRTKYQIHGQKRYRRPDSAYDALDADIIHRDVCVDAGWLGSVLDDVEYIWNNSNVYNQAPKIK